MLMLFISTPKIKQHAFHRVTALWILLKLNRWINGCLRYKVRYTVSQLSQAFQPWPLISLWNKRVDRVIRKLAFIELLLRNKPLWALNHFIFLATLLFGEIETWRGSITGQHHPARKWRSQNSNPSLTLLFSDPRLLAHDSACQSLSQHALQDLRVLSPHKGHRDQFSSNGDQEHRHPPSFKQRSSHFLYFTCRPSWFHPAFTRGDKKELQTTVLGHATS